MVKIDRSGHKGHRHPEQRAKEIEGETSLKRPHHDFPMLLLANSRSDRIFD
jgi:hypothetical protein